MRFGGQAFHSVGPVPKIKRALLYEIGIALVQLQWQASLQASLVGPTVQVEANKQWSNVMLSHSRGWGIFIFLICLTTGIDRFHFSYVWHRSSISSSNVWSEAEILSFYLELHLRPTLWRAGPKFESGLCLFLFIFKLGLTSFFLEVFECKRKWENDPRFDSNLVGQ